MTGFGTPRGWADARRAAARGLCVLWNGLVTRLRRWTVIPAALDWPKVVCCDCPLAA